MFEWQVSISQNNILQNFKNSFLYKTFLHMNDLHWHHTERPVRFTPTWLDEDMDSHPSSHGSHPCCVPSLLLCVRTRRQKHECRSPDGRFYVPSQCTDFFTRSSVVELKERTKDGNFKCHWQAKEESFFSKKFRNYQSFRSYQAGDHFSAKLILH